MTHPILPAGYDVVPNNGDEVDGAGVNEALWPELFDTFVPLQPFILTAEMLTVFDGRADVVVARTNNTIVVAPTNDTVRIAA